MRPALLRTIELLGSNFYGLATAEQLSSKMGINKSVVSGYLASLALHGLVERKYNHTSAPGRYIFAITGLGEKLLADMKSRADSG